MFKLLILSLLFVSFIVCGVAALFYKLKNNEDEEGSRLAKFHKERSYIFAGASMSSLLLGLLIL